jgi:hypothetical protein
MVKHKVRFGTINGDFLGEHEVDIPSEEEEEAERHRLYPDISRASYLQYPCYYCGTELYLINPYRSPNMNPLNEGFILVFENNDELKPTCKLCIKDLAERDERFRISRPS